MVTNYYPIDIKKEVLVLDLTYSYNIYHPDGLIGDAGVIVNKIRYSDDFIKEKALEENLREDDLCAKIENFFPNGTDLDRDYKNDKEYMRKGVGTRVLNLIIEDCKKKNIKFLYLKTATDSMINFSRKNGFNEYPSEYGFMNIFYKLIEA